MLAGFLVGFGARLANGDTSGHGICGVARLSWKSIVAVLIFLTSGAIMANFRCNVSFLASSTGWSLLDSDTERIISAIFFGLMLAYYVVFFILEFRAISLKEELGSLLVGVIYGFGLLVGGLCNSTMVTGFLSVTCGWNLTIAVVFGVAIGLTFLGFFLFTHIGGPVWGPSYQNPTGPVDRNLIIGAILFGLGWGMVGLSPGPALITFIS